MNLREKVKSMIRSWLEIQPANPAGITILESLTFQANAIRNQIWYRGDASELHQLYQQLDDGYVGRSRFWAAAPANESIRKIHSGLPALIVDTLAYIVREDMSDVVFKGNAPPDWEAISNAVRFNRLVGKAVVDALVSGDGAFKISVDPEISEYPLVEFYPGDRVEYLFQRGQKVGVRFFTLYRVKSKTYRLQEEYRKGSITYTLLDGDREVPLDTVPELAGLTPAEYDGDFMMAVPFQIFDSPRFPGRGKSIFDTKTDDFDAHDEVISQWIDALRAGRVQLYIPEDLIPRKPDDGSLMHVNSFAHRFVAVASPGTADVEKIDTVQPEIRYEAFLSTYTATLNLCLQGLISPATLGIDVGRMQSGEAQREKKDVTGNARNAITGALEQTLPELVSAILMTYDLMMKRPAGSYDPSVTFGEYGAPSFDARIDAISKAATAGIMSTEARVEELWGNSKDEAWKEQEVSRLKQEQGLTEAEPPDLKDELV